MLMLKPVLCTPNFQQWFKLAMDASDIGVELLCFKRMSMKSNILFVTSLKNFKRVRKIIAIVKELLALELAPKHIEIYICHLEGTQ